MSVSLERLERQLNYSFINSELLTLALTHRSFSTKNNERLEFLGDAILGFVVGEALFVQFPGATEGQLSRLRSCLVKGETLAILSRRLDLGEYLYLGSGELKSGGFRRESILADAFEAILGAIYLDSGIAEVQKFILASLKEEFSALTLVQTHKDAKTRLQEFLQSRSCALPQYDVIGIDGDPHCRLFTVQCQVDLMSDKTVAQGASRRIAEQTAAYLALIALGVESKND